MEKDILLDSTEQNCLLLTQPFQIYTKPKAADILTKLFSYYMLKVYLIRINLSQFNTHKATQKRKN